MCMMHVVDATKIGCAKSIFVSVTAGDSIGGAIEVSCRFSKHIVIVIVILLILIFLSKPHVFVLRLCGRRRVTDREQDPPICRSWLPLSFSFSFSFRRSLSLAGF